MTSGIFAFPLIAGTNGWHLGVSKCWSMGLFASADIWNNVSDRWWSGSCQNWTPALICSSVLATSWQLMLRMTGQVPFLLLKAGSSIQYECLRSTAPHCLSSVLLTHSKLTLLFHDDPGSAASTPSGKYLPAILETQTSEDFYSIVILQSGFCFHEMWLPGLTNELGKCTVDIDVWDTPCHNFVVNWGALVFTWPKTDAIN